MPEKVRGFRKTLGHRDPPVLLPTITGIDPDNPVLSRVDGQIRWYDEQARRTMTQHFRLRLVQLFAAALIPITQVFGGELLWRALAAGLAGVIAVAQGIDSMHHYAEHYVAWRSTCQRLLNERQLLSAAAGPYGKLPPHSEEALSLLAERASAIEGHELEQWQVGQLRTAEGDSAGSK